MFTFSCFRREVKIKINFALSHIFSHSSDTFGQVCEIRMLPCILRRYSVRRIESQHFGHQIHPIIIQGRRESMQWRWSGVLREVRPPVRKFRNPRESSFRWSAKMSEYSIKLGFFRGSCEERWSIHHLSKYATNAPDINWCRVMPRTQQDIRGPVP